MADICCLLLYVSIVFTFEYWVHSSVQEGLLLSISYCLLLCISRCLTVFVVCDSETVNCLRCCFCWFSESTIAVSLLLFKSLECCRRGICTASAFIIPRLRVAYARDILVDVCVS